MHALGVTDDHTDANVESNPKSHCKSNLASISEPSSSPDPISNDHAHSRTYGHSNDHAHSRTYGHLCFGNLLQPTPQRVPNVPCWHVCIE